MSPVRQPSLSKSTCLIGRQCTKLLWFRYNDMDQIPAPDEAQQPVFDQGHEVGELARQLGDATFPTYITQDVFTKLAKEVKYGGSDSDLMWDKKYGISTAALFIALAGFRTSESVERKSLTIYA